MTELCNSYECTGFSMCYNICNHNAISMEPDEDTSIGVSFVSINTIKSKNLFESMKLYIEYEEREIEETINGGNSQLKQPTKRPTERNNIYKQAYQLEWIDFIKQQNIPLKRKISLKKRIINKLWKIIKK